MCSISCISARRSSASDHSRASRGRTITGRRDAECHGPGHGFVLEQFDGQGNAARVREASKFGAVPGDGQPGAANHRQAPQRRRHGNQEHDRAGDPRDRAAIAPASRRAARAAPHSVTTLRRARARSGRRRRWGMRRARLTGGRATGTSIVIAGTNAIRIGSASERRERGRDHQVPRRGARGSRERRDREAAEHDQRRLGEQATARTNWTTAAPRRTGCGIITSSGSCAPDRFLCGAPRARRRSTIPA